MLPTVTLYYAELSPLFLRKQAVWSIGYILSERSGKSYETVLVVGIFELLAVIDLCLDLEWKSEHSGHSSSGLNLNYRILIDVFFSF